MATKAKVTIVVLVGTVVGFLLGGNAPLGQMIWPPVDTGMAPTGGQVAGFMLYAVVAAIAFGAGIAFLIWGRGLVDRAAPEEKGWALATYLSIAWLLVSWVPHDALHMNVGFDFAALLALEWGFHATLIVAGLVIARFFVKALEGQPGADAEAA